MVGLLHGSLVVSVLEIQGGSMPQDKNKDVSPQKKDTSQPRNESNPAKTPVGTTSSEELNAENSPDVREALNESQI